jgi:DNA-binding HxlR family transcriptional regulator
MDTMTGVSAQTSALAEALERVGDRWTLQVVEALLDGAKRFGDLSEAVAGIAPNILSARLKHLERLGLVAATAYSRRPLRFEYALTGAGAELAGVLRMLAGWAVRAGGEAAPVRHEACGTPVEPRWFCPTCARAVDERDTTELRLL